MTLIERLPSLRNLHVFLCVAGAGSVTAGAERLFRAQSAVTRSIKSLEEELGVELFERRARGMLLTEVGRIVQLRARRVQDELLACCEELAVLRKGQASNTLMHVLLNEQRLQNFVELARHRHLASVANLRGLSRSTVSMQVRKLEQHLKLRLLERSANGLQPTDAGRILSFRARRALGELRIIRQEVSATLGTMAGTVTIGALPLARTDVLPMAIVALIRRHPHVRIRTLESPYETLVKQLLSGDLDFIVGALRHVRKGGELETESLFVEPISLVARCGHPLHRCNRPTKADLGRAQWVLSRQGSPSRDLLAHSFQKMGLAPPVPLVETGDLALLRGLLLHTDLITAISPRQLQYEIDNGSLARLDIALDFTLREIGFTYRRNSVASPIAVLMREEIRSQCRQPE